MRDVDDGYELLVCQRMHRIRHVPLGGVVLYIGCRQVFPGPSAQDPGHLAQFLRPLQHYSIHTVGIKVVEPDLADRVRPGPACPAHTPWPPFGQDRQEILMGTADERVRPGSMYVPEQDSHG